jgi:Ca-activated chloride channel family protein
MQREHWVGLLPGGGAPKGAPVEARLHLILRRMCQEESTRSEVGVMQAVRPILCGIGLVVMTVILNSSLLRSQSAIDEVHIQRRAQSVKPDSPGGLAHDPTGIIRKSVQLVLVPVTVMDESNRIVTGLEQENFQLYENKQAERIKHFWKEDTPVSVGIVLDVSGSMDSKIERARDAVVAMLTASNPQDEFFLMTFADRPMLVQDFTSDVDDVRGQLLSTKPKGCTSLIDAIVMAISHMRNARYQRRALVIISDGGDNRSRYTEKELKSLIKEEDVLVYSIGVFDTQFRTMEERLGPELLATISGLTGASAYTLDNPTHLPVVAEHIANELRNQYILGYSPDGSRPDGKWRKIKVKLALPKGLRALRVQARSGYYGSAQR